MPPFFIFALMKFIIIYGPPGSGKGTQSKILSEKHGFCHISTGEILRTEISKKSEIGILAQKQINNGGFIDDEIAIQLIRVSLSKLYNNEIIILDGFPRTLNQAELFSEIAEQNIYSIKLFVNFEASPDTLIQRIKNRNKLSNRPEDSCDQFIDYRLKLFYSNHMHLYSYYSRKNILTTINVDKPIDKINKELEDLILKNL